MLVKCFSESVFGKKLANSLMSYRLSAFDGPPMDWGKVAMGRSPLQPWPFSPKTYRGILTSCRLSNITDPFRSGRLVTSKVVSDGITCQSPT